MHFNYEAEIGCYEIDVVYYPSVETIKLTAFYLTSVF